MERKPNYLPQNLQYLLLRKGWNRATLAKRLGLNRQTVDLWVWGKTKPNWKNLYKVCELFQVDPEYFQRPVKKEVKSILQSIWLGVSEDITATALRL